ncbi:hypothetical protein KFE98_15910 [bacterium SCSIO 12741]|nr:hypothetical protein KFE98_15910 [bacterium SCSIO 12741]
MNYIEADAGQDQMVGSGTSTTLEADSLIVPVSGLWTIIDGTGGSFAYDTAFNSLFTGTADSSYLLEWRVSFNGDTARDTVRISFVGDNRFWTAGNDWLDTRDQEVYGTVTIGNQVWMSENLRYRNASGNVFYNDDSATYRDFGRLYTHNQAILGGGPL